MKNCVRTILIVLSVIVLSSCDGYEKLLKSADYDAQYKAAVEYYQQGRYTKARQLFENLQVHFRNKEQSENIAWYYCNTLYKSGSYALAAYNFSTFNRKYPYSTYAEDALFLSAYCKYLDAPSYSLDQSISKDAIKDFEYFADRYPQSTRIPEVNACLDKLQSQLERKDFEIAMGYFRTENYHAAYVSLKNFLNLYPHSQYREEAMFTILRSGYQYAANSQESKMKERLQSVINDFENYVATFTDPKYVSTSQTIYNKTKALLAQIEEQENKK